MGWFKVCFGIRRNENTPNKLLVASSLQEDKVKRNVKLEGPGPRPRLGKQQVQAVSSNSAINSSPSLQSKNKFKIKVSSGNCSNVKSSDNLSIQQLVISSGIDNNINNMEKGSKQNVGYKISLKEEKEEEEEKRTKSESFSSATSITITHSSAEDEATRKSEEEETTSDSLFSLSIDSRKRVVEMNDNDDDDDKEVNSSITIQLNQDRRDVCSVLNPIENLTQWKKETKGGATSFLHVNADDDDKENVKQQVNAFSQEEPTSPNNIIMQQKRRTQQDSEIAVDASLSSWLIQECSSFSSVTSTPRRSSPS